MKNTEAYYHEEEEGLACPPMDDYAMSDAFFYGDRQCGGMNFDPNVFFADVPEELEDLHSHKKKPLFTRYRYKGEGKEWKRVLQVPEGSCRVAVEGVTVHKSTCVTKARPEIKIPAKKPVNNVSMQMSSNMHKKKNRTETRKPNILMPKNDKDFELKLESTKRKLRDSYDQANNLKKRRSTQLIDFQHLPPMQTTNKKSLKAKTKPN